MTTANIVMAICLVALMGVAVWLIIRYMRKASEVEIKEQELAQQKSGLEKKDAALHRWEQSLKKDKESLDIAMLERKHVFYNVIVDNANGEAPEHPDRNSMKAMKSGIGYKIAPLFEQNIKATPVDGKMKYSLDVWVMPYVNEREL